MLSYFSLSDISLVLDFAVSEPTFPLAVSGSPIAGLLFAAVAAEKVSGAVSGLSLERINSNFDSRAATLP